jgi:hypothetical protein
VSNGLQRNIRLFAPAVLALAVLFPVVSDPGASCLAAWLCSAPATEDCDPTAHNGPVVEQSSSLCTFEARLDRAIKLEPVKLQLAPWIVLQLDGPPGHTPLLHPEKRAVPASSVDPPPPLYSFHLPLLI